MGSLAVTANTWGPLPYDRQTIFFLHKDSIFLGSNPLIASPEKEIREVLDCNSAIHTAKGFAVVAETTFIGCSPSTANGMIPFYRNYSSWKPWNTSVLDFVNSVVSLLFWSWNLSLIRFQNIYRLSTKFREDSNVFSHVCPSMGIPTWPLPMLHWICRRPPPPHGTSLYSPLPPLVLLPGSQD